MLSFASNAFAGATGQKKNSPQQSQACSKCSDDEVSSNPTRDEGLECPICCESFNIVENVPYVLWCGHTLCKNCILALQWAVVKFPTLPIQLPLLISCPWCHLLSFRLIYKGNLKFPRKNFFLLWMVESLNGDRVKIQHSDSSFTANNHQQVWPSNNISTGRSQVNNNPINLSRATATRGDHQEQRRPVPNQVITVGNYLNRESLNSTLRKSLVFFREHNSKVPLGRGISSYHLVCSTCQCCYIAFVHTCHCPVCISFISYIVFCIP